MSDALTAHWVRNPSDESAVAAGCRFEAERAAYLVWWIERYCRLYEGEQAGEPLILRGCHQCGTYDLPPADTMPAWDDEAKRVGLERASRYAECVQAGHAIDWQYECLMRLFGWVRFSEKWQRWVRRFRQASIWVAKKNKKSPTLAAIALYLLAGDGEPGAKVYLGAKDGGQAREIAGKHAMEMVLSSPDLSAECSTNKNLMQVTHEPSRSLLKPLSSGNSRHQQAKEGLNGSILIDETHVVDAEFVGRVSRAGISRSEPLQIEVSTAGDNPAGYGKGRFDLAADVLAGRVQLQELFAAIYAAPQDLPERELMADPLKYARLANPAMGHTVDPEELLADLKASRAKLIDLGRCLQYRFNIWQSAAKPWLNMGAWGRNKAPRDEAALVGLPCSAGLDLAKTRDTCALVLCFDLGADAYYLLPHFWLPRKRAEDLRDQVPYLQWAAEDWLTLCDGDIIDYGMIRKKIVELNQRFFIGRLVYDDTYAQQLVQRLLEEHGFLYDQPWAFAQTLHTFAKPTDDFEADVLSGTLLHNGNPLMTWQAGNAQVRTDGNLNKRPVKQKPGDVRTIDGIVAGIMARSQIGIIAAGRYEPGSLRD